METNMALEDALFCQLSKSDLKKCLVVSNLSKGKKAFYAKVNLGKSNISFAKKRTDSRVNIIYTNRFGTVYKDRKLPEDARSMFNKNYNLLKQFNV